MNRNPLRMFSASCGELCAISTLELYYMPTVHTFNMKRIDSLIKSDEELRQYIEALKRVSDGWERLAKDAMAKLRQQTTPAATNNALVPCPTCGAACSIGGDDEEGTHYFVPVVPFRAQGQ